VEMPDQARKHEGGFTLIELLIAIVVVGVLTSVAIVGIGGLTDNGSHAACEATKDAARVASTVFYANSGTNTFPSDFFDLTSPNPLLAIPSGVAPQVPADGDQMLTGTGWTLTMTGTGSAAPTFSDCP
jgi:prepilin-type N-terminal cleavage/methylation domain-containing protein